MTQSAPAPAERRERSSPFAPLLARADLAAVATLWLGAGYGLSRVTGRITDWFVMTDELLYERLAISVAQTGSPLPYVRGELITSLNQLYPVLIAPAFRGGLVPDSLHDAHVLNAFLMTSVAVPAFLLARSVAASRGVALVVAVASVAVPWIVLSSFLLTEVAAYPAFVWAVYALHAATASPRTRNDVLALLALALAVSARVQFVVLAAVLPLAVLSHEVWAARAPTRPARIAAAARAAVGRHPVLAVAYALGAVGAVVLAAVGEVASALGTYAASVRGDLFDASLVPAFAEHLAALALALGILPLLVAVAWLLRALVGRVPPHVHAFAAVGAWTLVLLTLQVASFDLRFGGGIVRDRYLFYAVPVALVALAGALVTRPWPRWSLLAPAAVVGTGFAVGSLPRFEKLNVDTPLAVVHDTLVRLGESEDGARAGLVLTTGVLVLLFLQAAPPLPRPLVAGALAATAVLVPAAGAAAAFHRLLDRPGTSGREPTHDQGAVFDWIDRTVGPDAKVTMVPFPPVRSDYWASVAFWWDAEFWNKSVVRAAYRNGEYQATPATFAGPYLEFDDRTGRASHTETPYVAQHSADTRFRIAGPVVASERDTYLIRAERPWRAEWVSRGLYRDGWTRPDEPAVVRVFALPGQTGPVRRYLGFYLRDPAAGGRPYAIRGGMPPVDGVAGENGRQELVELCVPAGGYAEATLTTTGSAEIHGEPVSAEELGRPRRVGVLVYQIALADEVEPGCVRAGP